MPALAIPVIANALVAVGVGAALSTFIATVFVYAASAVLLNAVAKSLAPKPRANAGLGSGQEINYFDTGSGVRIVYGTTQVGGMETIPPITSGLNFRYLHKLLTVAGHKTELLHAQFDTTSIATAIIAANSGAASATDGQVTSGVFSGHAWIRYYNGNSLAYTFDNFLNTLTSNFYGANLQATARDISTCAITLLFNQQIYTGGVPTFTFRINGKKVYDPRLDVTPGASPTNATYAPTANPNPALCLADYLMASYGGGYTSDEIDWDKVVTAANYCEQSVAIPTASTRARYTANGVLYATTEFTDNVKLLVDSMLGKLIFNDGKWRMYAGSWATPSFTIQQADWISGLSIRFEQGKIKRFNKAHCWYVDKARNYQRLECLPQSDAGYLAIDGEEFEAETEQLFCNNEYEAQAKARLLLRQSRNQIIVSGTLPPRFQNIALWDTGTIVMEMFGWSSKTFRAASLSLRPDGAIDCVFAEEQEDDWDDLIEADYNNQSITPLPAANATTPSEPTSFTAVEQINGTILFTIGTPVIKPPGTRFQVIRSSVSTNAAVGTVIYEGDSAIVPLVMVSSNQWYYSRCITNSLVSAYQPNTTGLLARASPEAGHKFSRDLSQDPDFIYSVDNSVYWVASNTNVWSFNPATEYAGIGGTLVCRPWSLGNAHIVVAQPQAPYPRYIANRGVQFNFRSRFLTSNNSVAFGIDLFVVAQAWNGLFPILDNLGPMGTGNLFVNISSPAGATGVPNSGQWITITRSSMLTAPASPAMLDSYPYCAMYIFQPSRATHPNVNCSHVFELGYIEGKFL